MGHEAAEDGVHVGDTRIVVNGERMPEQAGPAAVGLHEGRSGAIGRRYMM